MEIINLGAKNCPVGRNGLSSPFFRSLSFKKDKKTVAVMMASSYVLKMSDITCSCSLSKLKIKLEPT